MDEFCPNCRANIGFGTYEIIGCPVCGAEPELDDEDFVDEFDDENDELDDKPEEKISRPRPHAHTRTPPPRTKKQKKQRKRPAKKG